MSNFLVQDEKTIVYKPAAFAGNVSIIFIKDDQMPPSTVRWDVLGTGFVFYNLPEFTRIVSIAETTDQIYSQYVTKSFTQIPTPETNLPKWVTFNPENNCYYIRFDLVFTTSVDYSSIPTCKFYTPSITNFKSSSYQYANSSIGNVCSEPALNSFSPDSVIYCPYSSVFSSSNPSECPSYSQDLNILHDLLLSSKFSENKINITVSVSRMDMGKTLCVLFEDKINKSVFHKLSFDSLDQEQINNIPSMVNVILDEILSQYTQDYNVSNQNNSEQNVTIKKKSFISSLIEDEKEDLYV